MQSGQYSRVADIGRGILPGILDIFNTSSLHQPVKQWDVWPRYLQITPTYVKNVLYPERNRALLALDPVSANAGVVSHETRQSKN